MVICAVYLFIGTFMVSESTELGEQLAKRSTPVATTDPDTELTDLDPVGEALADAQVIGLGEATHGTREFFRLKHRIVRHLVEEQGIRLFGLEANFSETLALDRYVRHGEGDPRDGLSDIYFWTWDTKEVLALIEWLRTFNEGRSLDDRVGFIGFDAQYTSGPAAALGEYLETTEPDLREELADTLSTLDDDGQISDDSETREKRLDAADRVIDVLEETLCERETAHVAATDRATWQLARQHLRTLAQARDRKQAQHDDDLERAMTVRDRAMAENIVWMLDHETADRVVLWAHNGHVSRTENVSSDGTSVPSMGHHLADRYGERYYSLGFDFAEGTFQAIVETEDGYELTGRSLGAPLADSVAELFAAADKQVLFADLDVVTASDRLAEWFDEPRMIRSIGARYYGDEEVERHHDRRVIPEAYDGVLFVGETTKAVPVSRE